MAYWYKHDLTRIIDRLETLGVKYGKLDSDQSIEDYKFFCFNGKPEIVALDLERFGNIAKRNLYDMKWLPHAHHE